MTDNRFLGLVKKASADDRYYFTFSQLYLVFSSMRTNEVGIFVFYPMAFLVCSASPQPIIFLSILVAIGIIHLIINLYRSPPNQEELRMLVKKWSNAKGSLNKMLVKPSLHKPPPEFQEGDIYDYGVERIIIVERPILVDLLVKNNFHADQKALVFSMDGYPTYIVEKAKKLLNESLALPIYLLHDATEEGMSMREKITSPDQSATAILPELKGMTDDRPSFTAKKKKVIELYGEFCEELSGMEKFDLLHKSVEDGMTVIQKKTRQPVRTVLDLGVFPEQIKNLSVLKSLHLKQQEYQAPLDALPYAALSGLSAAAIAAHVPFDEVLASWNQDGSSLGDSSASNYG